MRRLALVIGLILLGYTSARPAAASLIEKSGTFAGLTVAYKVVLPDGYDPARAYPMILVFTGGGQDLAAAEGTVSADWRAEGEKRGYIVVSPASPNGELFYEGADKIFPAFLETLLHDYKVTGGKIHVAGHSNGGLSAFHVAVQYPAFFSTVTGYPGLLNDPDLDKVANLKPMCLYMHVGDGDPIWQAVMFDQAQMMQDGGYRIAFTTEKNQGHRLKAAELGLPARLYDEIEHCTASAIR